MEPILAILAIAALSALVAGYYLGFAKGQKQAEDQSIQDTRRAFQLGREAERKEAAESLPYK